jgi:hypothetical protein
MSLEEAILDKVRRPPPAEQEEVLRFADGLQDDARARIVPSRDRTVKMKWIDLNRAAYADQWVAVEGDRLVAVGNDSLKVIAAAKEEGVRIPFVVPMLPEDPLPHTDAPMESRRRSRNASGGNRLSSWQNWIQAPHIASLIASTLRCLG